MEAQPAQAAYEVSLILSVLDSSVIDVIRHGAHSSWALERQFQDDLSTVLAGVRARSPGFGRFSGALWETAATGSDSGHPASDSSRGPGNGPTRG